MNITITNGSETLDGKAMGAFYAGTVNEGQPLITINVAGLLSAMLGDKDVPLHEGFLDAFIQTVVHEVGHALEEWCGLEFSEARIERITESYIEDARKRLGVA